MKYASISKPGGREENQDTVGWVMQEGCFVACICDGLGGHSGGAIASSAALAAALLPLSMPSTRIHAANGAVLSAQVAHGIPSMRTTAIVMELYATYAIWAHCGDTRLYLLRDGVAVPLTQDHSVPQSLVRQGVITADEIRYHEDRSRLVRALGVADLKWDEGKCDCHTGDIFLLATDGFWEPILESDMVACSDPDPEKYLQNMENLLLKRVEPGYDNYSALVMYVS